MKPIFPFFYAFMLAITASCCPAPSSTCDLERYRDVTPTPEEAKLGEPCVRAYQNLSKVCPERIQKIEALAKTDYVTWCRKQIEDDQPICPSTLARVKSCNEAAHVCR